jgi:F-type H+-transporting ATPase subunit epsilon
MDVFALEIVTPEGRLTTAEVEFVEIPGVDGELGIYAGHTPLLTALSTGELRVYLRTEIAYYAVAGGYVEVRPELVRVVATFACAGEDEARIEDACQRAKTALEVAENEPDDVIKGEVQALKHELVKLAGAHRKRRPAQGK